MINIQNLGSKENLGVKFKGSICAELYLIPWFENDWFFCNITMSGWLESDFPEIEFQTVTS